MQHLYSEIFISSVLYVGTEVESHGTIESRSAPVELLPPRADPVRRVRAARGQRRSCSTRDETGDRQAGASPHGCGPRKPSIVSANDFGGVRPRALLRASGVGVSVAGEGSREHRRGRSLPSRRERRGTRRDGSPSRSRVVGAWRTAFGPSRVVARSRPIRRRSLTRGRLGTVSTGSCDRVRVASGDEWLEPSSHAKLR